MAQPKDGWGLYGGPSYHHKRQLEKHQARCEARQARIETAGKIALIVVAAILVMIIILLIMP